MLVGTVLVLEKKNKNYLSLKYLKSFELRISLKNYFTSLGEFTKFFKKIILAPF